MEHETYLMLKEIRDYLLFLVKKEMKREDDKEDKKRKIEKKE